MARRVRKNRGAGKRGNRSSGDKDDEALQVARAAEPVRISLISLGCTKNLVDSEVILGRAGEVGIAVTPHPEDAEIILINTCGFIAPAKEESINTILQACQVKEHSSGKKKVVVTGCLAQRYGETLRREIPQIDAVVGVSQYGELGDLLLNLARSSRDSEEPLYRVSDPNKACTADVGRFRLTPKHYAYIRISEGCDNPCTFCSIPAIRGRFRSKPLSQVEAEVRELAQSGAREFILISQDSTSYGLDLEGHPRLPELLERVASIEGVRWVRLLYAYPSSLTEEIIDAVATIPQVLNYLDLPLQHIDDRMLRRMGRKMSETNTRRLLSRLRERIPGLYLRTTFLVGFPGEGDEEFQRLVDFAKEFRFERLGVFPYSSEEGTPAARMKEEVPEKVRQERLEELMLVQQEIAFSQNHRRIGEICQVVIDTKERGQWLGRSHGEAPEIDPRIIVQRPAGGDRKKSSQDLVGWFLEVKITGTRAYDLIAQPLRHEDR